MQLLLHPEAQTPDLSSYDLILLNTSGGKDSQAMIDHVTRLARAAGVSERVIAVHCDLGRVEWRGTRELAELQARHYGIRFEVVRKPGGDLLEYIEHRGKWPSSTARYCTSDFKRGPVRVLMTRLVAERWSKGGIPIRILNCMGLRAEESPARAKRAAFSYDARASNKTKRHVDEWLPIHDWTEQDVWTAIRKAGVPHHWAYDLGMPRLSCVFCIFAPRSALLIAAQHNPDLLRDYVAVEKGIGHTFRTNQSLVEIQTAALRGDLVGPILWAQCA